MVSEITISESKDLQTILNELIDVGKKVVERGLAVGSGGNLSFRAPGTDIFFVTGTGTQLDQLTPSSFAQVNLQGEHLDGIKPSSEFRVHLESYKTRPDIDVCIHLHPQASVLTAALDLPIRFITIDHVYYVRKVNRIPWIRSGTQEIAEATAVAVKDSNVVILENHGCVVVADNPRLAYSRALNLEEAAEMTIRSALLKVKPKLVPQEFEQYLKQQGL